MKDTANYRRTAVAASLVAAPLLVVLSSLLQPPFVASQVDRLADIDEAGAAAWLSNTAFILTQVPMLVAFLGIAHLLRRSSPILSSIGATLAVLATLSEAVMGGISMVWLTVAGDAANRELFAQVWEDVEGSPVMAFGMVGFLGTVLTIVVLSIGLFRSRLVPRWVPALLWAFIVLEYFASNVSEFASYAGGICLLIAFGTLAAHVWRSPRRDWELPEGAVSQPVPANA